jgi:putative Holliday junction resolvase
MRAMAVDYGDRRTGVAVSDISRSIVGDCFVIDEPNRGKLANRIETEYMNRGADTLVLGNPLNMNGTTGSRVECTAAFKTMLEKRGLRVVLWDERRTTVEAGELLREAGSFGRKRKSKIDAVAASLILEGFLLSEKNLAQTDQSGQDPETDP